MILTDTFTCPILGPLVSLFWISSHVCSGLQSQSGLPYSHYTGECNVCTLRSTSGATHCQPLHGQHCGVMIPSQGLGSAPIGGDAGPSS